MTGASGLAAMKRNDGQTDVYLELNPGETVIVSTSSQNLQEMPMLIIKMQVSQILFPTVGLFLLFKEVLSFLLP